MYITAISDAYLKPDLKANSAKNYNNNLKTEKLINSNYKKSSDLVYNCAYYPNISFLGTITPEQRKKCHVAIHGASAVCAGFSGAMGEGAAVGADTPFLWGTQAMMFLFKRSS